MAITGNSATVQYGSSASGSWTTIPGITEVSPPKENYEKVDTTSLSDTAKTAIPSIPDPGSSGFTLLHAGASTITLLSTLVGTLKYYKISYSDSSNQVFYAWASQPEPMIANNEAAKWKVVLECSGSVTRSAS